MEKIEKARKEQMYALISIFSWVSILVMLVGACVYGGLFGVYVYIWFLLPEMIFVTCGVVCNTIDYFKARKKFNKLVEQKVREDLVEYATKAIDIPLAANEIVNIVSDLERYKELLKQAIKTRKKEEGE